MRALKAALSTSLSWMSWEKTLPEPEPFCANPRPMTGFLATMSEEQVKLARDYRGDDTHGDKAFAR
ncbi:hypothetical protein ACSBOB_11465 [Mesorhizobium sp. ASY16-5R]|uniref:hypothetical protein n=1 Tax=Mesorhizobium sp. ASY16-5R TaxID=3445772 RepID=UPI003F9F3A0A